MDGRMGGEKGLKLFGVRIVDEDREWRQEGGGGGEDDPVKQSMLKSVSMVDLGTCVVRVAGERRAGDHEYLSDGGLEQASRRGVQERKRGVPWSEEEHRTFLAGLEKLGRGDWRGISRNFVMTRTPTQVASHAQKYFLRQTNTSKKKRRSSLFDVVIHKKFTNSGTSPTSPLKKSDENFKVFERLNPDSHSAGYSCITTIQLPAASCSSTPIPRKTSSTELAAQNMKFNVSDQADPSFFKLNLPISPPKKLAKSSAIENSDLELTIAPPQSHHNLAKFSSGIIGVV
ncbi:probable transcription factor At5g61620 [Phalaenopsis equestris]|uniref:probable transcription factor At5g61620 n=1 Tax=Phalaenopsis equestris TaxID=78828 RepID=UPI0009E59B6B|nr:probable transcription factor At5g61620 [Phalaenopsis equestris]